MEHTSPDTLVATETITPHSVSTTSAMTQDSYKEYFAIASVALGIISLPGLCCGGICCAPFQIFGIVTGILGLKSEKYKSLAIIGLVLSSLALLLNIVFLVINIILGVTIFSLSSLKN